MPKHCIFINFSDDSDPHQYLRIIVVSYFHNLLLLLPALYLLNFVRFLSIFQIKQIYLRTLSFTTRYYFHFSFSISIIKV